MYDNIAIPMKTIGPVKIIGQEINALVHVPLATLESPLWPSTNRGASVSRHCEGIRCTIVDDRMTRSVLLQGPSAEVLFRVVSELKQRRAEIAQKLAETSRFVQLLDWNTQIVGDLLYLRLEANSGDASGHNMLTKAADAVQHWIISEYPELRYVSISANYCVDKKVSAVNGILGRGKNVIAEMLIPRALCQSKLKTTPEAIVDLNIKKNLLGSIISGGIRTANAHFANMLYALYLATGQDVANIVEGSQGIVHTELRGEDLYFSITLPNLIVGTIGNGKQLEVVQDNLNLLGCNEADKIGHNARRLAMIFAATVLCGELSLLAAQTNPGELMRAHHHFERGNAKYHETALEIKVRTPAKLILSGEHAVVYGQPALAIAVNRHIETTVKWASPLHFSFNLMGIDFRQKVTLEALKRLKYKLTKQYQEFHKGQLDIRNVLKNPFELTLYTAINVIEKIKHKLPMGIDIANESTIPIGCGMGSSAASVVSVIYAISKFLKTEFSIEDYVRLGVESENLQHGYSSGLDVQVVYQGGCIYYQEGSFQTRPLPKFPMYLINTGKPEANTGQCVAHAKHHFTNNTQLKDDFAAVTKQLDKAIQQNDLNDIMTCIRENHRLLSYIGVVPDKVAQFIQSVETQGGAAKICGAGSTRGEHAGAMLIVGEQNLSQLAEQYGYELIPIEGDQRGTHVV